MKKSIIILIIVVFLITLVCFITVLFNNKNNKKQDVEISSSENHQWENVEGSTSKKQEVEEFTLEKYQWEIENFPYDKNVGKVDNQEIAIEKAKELWKEKFKEDDDELSNYSIEVSYNSEENCWHIYNTLPQDPPGTISLGGILHALIRKNGEVMAVWAED